MLRDTIFGIITTVHSMLPQAQTMAQQLLFVLLLLDLIIFGIQVALGSRNNIADLVMQILKMGLFVFLLTNFVSISQAFMQSIMKLSSVTGYHLSNRFLADPMAILEYAFTDILTPFDKAMGDKFGWLPPLQILVLYIIVKLGILACFLLISLQLAVAFIEYHITVYMGLILFPFCSFEPTQFVGSKVFSAVAGQAIKLGLISLVTGIAINIYRTFIIIPGSEAFCEAFMIKVLASTLLLLLVAIQIPALASSLLSGIPNFSVAGFAQNIGAMLNAAPMRALGEKYSEWRREEKKDNELVKSLKESGWGSARAATADSAGQPLNGYFNRSNSDSNQTKPPASGSSSADSQSLNQMMARKS